ncbi:hypothetical protein JKY72_05460 [Candidatus Gracilibacteria bacterium]|nr:hypothetical protein [Candidatus Gracilibacteria bacterium]
MNLSDHNLLILSHVMGKEAQLVEKIIVDGPSSVKAELALNDEQWIVVFDHLVFDQNLLYKVVNHSMDFFKEKYIKHGMTHVREVLDVVDEKYDVVVELIFDQIAIVNDGLKFHVLEHRDRYVMAFRSRGGEFIKKVLGLHKEKYEESWAEVLDVLLHAVCDSMFSEQTYEHGLRAFSLLMNGMRDHRRIWDSGIIV